MFVFVALTELSILSVVVDDWVGLGFGSVGATSNFIFSFSVVGSVQEMLDALTFLRSFSVDEPRGGLVGVESFSGLPLTLTWGTA